MAYSSGNTAVNSGRNRRKTSAACLRASRTFPCSEAARIENTDAKLSSWAKVSDIIRKNLAPFRLPIVDRKHCIETRQRTRTALGSGSSISGSGFNANDIDDSRTVGFSVPSCGSLPSHYAGLQALMVKLGKRRHAHFGVIADHVTRGTEAIARPYPDVGCSCPHASLGGGL